jgi:lysophospholipase L1-like esterase
MSRLKKSLRILRQTIIIVLITFALTEIAFRIYGRVNPTFIFYGNSYNRFRAKPNSYHYDFRMNSKGFNDVEFNPQKAEGTFRIIGIGDSFAYGVVPYQNNYLTVLEENLNKSGQKIELLNMGISSTGPKDYLSVLVKEGLELKPDMVMLSFFIGNDFTDPTVEKVDRGLYTYSYVATFIKYMIDINTKYKDQPVIANPSSFDVYQDDKPTFDDDYFFKLEVGRSEIYKKQSSLFDSQFAEALGYLKQIKAICEARKIALTVVLIPDEVQVNKALQAKVMQVKTFSVKAEDFDFTMPNRRLGASLQEAGIKYIDLMNDFVNVANQTTLYKPDDTHWNIAGNKLAAEMIQKRLFGDATDQDTTPVKESATPAAPSTYEGVHDRTDCQSVKGWAWDTRYPNAPIKIELYDGESLIATIPADRFRKDLLDAHKGNGAHAFEYTIPARLKDDKPHTIRAKIAGTETPLTNTAQQIRCPLK